MPRVDTREPTLVKPLLFNRESVTGRHSVLSVNMSQYGVENVERGSTIMFKDIVYQVRL